MKALLRALFITFVLFISVQAGAQLKGIGFGPYFEIARPTAGFEDTHGNGFGLGLGLDMNLPGKLGVTASAGFMHIGGHTQPALNGFPIRVGVKYQLPLVYLKFESGAVTFTNSEATHIIVAPGIGIRLLGFDVQGKFEAWVKDETRSFWGLKLGYQF